MTQPKLLIQCAIQFTFPCRPAELKELNLLLFITLQSLQHVEEKKYTIKNIPCINSFKYNITLLHLSDRLTKANL
jgi:hypothetical protein